MIVASRYPLRKLLLATITLFAVSHVASAFAGGFWSLMLSRIGVAFAHSIFWSVASPIAVRLVSGPFKALAMSMIVTGRKVSLYPKARRGNLPGFSFAFAAMPAFGRAKPSGHSAEEEKIKKRRTARKDAVRRFFIASGAGSARILGA